MCTCDRSAKAKKFYLCLFAGLDAAQQVPVGLKGEAPRRQVRNEGRRVKKRRGAGGGDKAAFKSREWVLQKKEVQRKKGDKVRPDSKYTGRKRQDKLV